MQQLITMYDTYPLHDTFFDSYILYIILYQQTSRAEDYWNFYHHFAIKTTLTYSIFEELSSASQFFFFFFEVSILDAHHTPPNCVTWSF